MTTVKSWLQSFTTNSLKEQDQEEKQRHILGVAYRKTFDIKLIPNRSNGIICVPQTLQVTPVFATMTSDFLTVLPHSYSYVFS